MVGCGGRGDPCNWAGGGWQAGWGVQARKVTEYKVSVSVGTCDYLPPGAYCLSVCPNSRLKQHSFEHEPPSLTKQTNLGWREGVKQGAVQTRKGW